MIPNTYHSKFCKIMFMNRLELSFWNIKVEVNCSNGTSWKGGKNLFILNIWDISLCNELEEKSVNRSEIFKPCNSEIAAEPPHCCIIGTLLVHSFTVVSGGGNASKLEFSGGSGASTAELWGLDFFPLHASLQFCLRYQFSDKQWDTEPICVQSLPLF